MSEMPNRSQEFKPGTGCLNRNTQEHCYGLLKVNGKQIRHVLSKLQVSRIAKRRLIELRAKAERSAGQENQNIRFEELAHRIPASPLLREAASIYLNKFAYLPVKVFAFTLIRVHSNGAAS